MTAQMPPNVHGEIEEVRSEIEQINVGLRKEFEDLPERLKTATMGELSGQAKQMMIVAKEKAGDLRNELAAVEATIPPGEIDLRGKILKAITREPTPKERKDMGTIGELIWNLGRMKAAEYLQEQGSPGSSVTYRVTSKSPYGL